MSKEELYNIVFDTPELKEYVENKDKEIEILKYIIKESIEYIEIVYDYLLVDKNFIDDDLRQKQKEIKDLMKILKSGDE